MTAIVLQDGKLNYIKTDNYNALLEAQIRFANTTDASYAVSCHQVFKPLDMLELSIALLNYLSIAHPEVLDESVVTLVKNNLRVIDNPDEPLF